MWTIAFFQETQWENGWRLLHKGKFEARSAKVVGFFCCMFFFPHQGNTAVFICSIKRFMNSLTQIMLNHLFPCIGCIGENPQNFRPFTFSLQVQEKSVTKVTVGNFVSLMVWETLCEFGIIGYLTGIYHNPIMPCHVPELQKSKVVNLNLWNV